MKPAINLWMDSGAFSSHTQGITIDVKQYGDFLLQNASHISTPVNLDSINPGNPERAATEGWDNFLYLRDRGVTTLPVFHARESITWLDKMLSECKYVGLSGTSLVSPTEHMQWYKLMWDHVTDSLGRPVAKFHAFGDTSPVSLKRFPWYSCDSASWQLQSGMNGSVVIDGRCFRLRSKTITDRNFLSQDDPLPKQESWKAEIRRRGINPDLLMSETLRPVELACLRCYLNASYFLDLQESSRETTRYSERAGLMTVKKYGPGVERDGPVNLFFVVSSAVCAWALPVLTKLKVRNILMSYHYCEPKFWQREFVPFLYDPEEQCQSNPRLRRYWDLLERFCVR